MKVIASVEDFSIYTFVKDGDDPVQLIEKAETQFVNFPQYNKKYSCIPYEEYKRLEKQHCANTCKSTDEDTYWYMLEVLPPIYINGLSIPGYEILNLFLVCEPLSGNYYNAYLKYRNPSEQIKYATKVVLRNDKTTYFTREDLDKLETQ